MCRVDSMLKDIILLVVIVVVQAFIVFTQELAAIIVTSYPYYAFVTFEAAIIFGVIDLAVLILLIYALSRPNCRLISGRVSAIFTLVASSTFTGVSMAYFIAYLAYSFSTSSTVRLILPTLSLILALSQVLFIIVFNEVEVNVLGGSLIMTAIGILATSIGIILPAPQITFSASQNNLPVIAGPLIASGLILIALGLQKYYEERRTQAKCTSNPH